MAIKKAVIREDLVELTGHFIKALVLNQFLYWTDRVRDFDKFIKEEKERAVKGGIEINITETGGWIYKSADKLKNELMINKSGRTIRRHLQELVEEGYLFERKNPDYRWDQTRQYRVNLIKINKDLMQKGYILQGYKISEIMEYKTVDNSNGEKEKSLHDQFAIYAE